MDFMLRRNLLGSVVCLGLLAMGVVAKAEEDSYFGPQVGLFYPQSQVLKDALGDSWFSFGASRVRVMELDKHKLTHDWNAISQRDNGSSVFILTGSIGYVMPFAQEGSTTEPYFALRGGLAYMDYAVDTPGGREASKRLGTNANAALGILVSKKLNIEARYDVWSGQSGLNFNGLTLSARYGLIRF